MRRRWLASENRNETIIVKYTKHHNINDLLMIKYRDGNIFIVVHHGFLNLLRV